MISIVLDEKEKNNKFIDIKSGRKDNFAQKWKQFTGDNIWIVNLKKKNDLLGWVNKIKTRKKNERLSCKYK